MDEQAFDQELLDAIAALRPITFEGTVWRHMFGDNPPELANTGGARWNPPGVDAIYTSLERGTAIAEGDYRLGIESIRPRVKRTVYQMNVSLASVVDLADAIARRRVGLAEADLSAPGMAKTSIVGGAVDWLGHDGLLVRSVRADGVNLVVFPNRMEERSGRLTRGEMQVIYEPT